MGMAGLTQLAMLDNVILIFLPQMQAMKLLEGRIVTEKQNVLDFLCLAME